MSDQLMLYVGILFAISKLLRQLILMLGVCIISVSVLFSGFIQNLGAIRLILDLVWKGMGTMEENSFHSFMMPMIYNIHTNVH